jgi:adenosyl cobinamide kinase/adenosyl cobinamide phosphate guanylyltransferase
VGEAVEVLVGRVVGVADVPHDLLLEGEVGLDKGIDPAQGRNEFVGRDIVGELAQQVVGDPDQVLLVVVEPHHPLGLKLHEKGHNAAQESGRAAGNQDSKVGVL